MSTQKILAISTEYDIQILTPEVIVDTPTETVVIDDAPSAIIVSSDTFYR
ncbi:hypothetical protein [Candidatus Epulonipiscium viviparus]|nr:hypothetical protein [Candidatus Epulopiscium viviparus]